MVELEASNLLKTTFIEELESVKKIEPEDCERLIQLVEMSSITKNQQKISALKARILATLSSIQ